MFLFLLEVVGSIIESAAEGAEASELVKNVNQVFKIVKKINGFSVEKSAANIVNHNVGKLVNILHKAYPKLKEIENLTLSLRNKNALVKQELNKLLSKEERDALHNLSQNYYKVKSNFDKLVNTSKPNKILSNVKGKVKGEINEAKKELNNTFKHKEVVIMAEIGAGKSTWIDSILFRGVVNANDTKTEETYGTLLVTLQSGKSYLYYGVPYALVKIMISATGGVGSLFWRGYLSQYHSADIKGVKSRVKTQNTRVKRIINIQNRNINNARKRNFKIKTFKKNAKQGTFSSYQKQRKNYK